METITVQIRKKAGKNILLDLEKKNIIKIVSEVNKEKLKRRVKKDLEEGLKLVELHQAGKIKLKSAREFLNEL
jgi:hypothetical protein